MQIKQSDSVSVSYNHKAHIHKSAVLFDPSEKQRADFAALCLPLIAESWNYCVREEIRSALHFIFPLHICRGM